jgi:hypothetical protein
MGLEFDDNSNSNNNTDDGAQNEYNCIKIRGENNLFEGGLGLE